MALQAPTTAENYSSAEQFADEIESTFQEERDMGMVLGAFLKEEAVKVCKCRPADLCVGAMAAIQEADKVRTVLNATIVGVNDNIRSHINKKTTSPTLHDLLWERGQMTDEDLSLFKSDVSKAHRRIKIRRQDWKHMIATIKNLFWVNMVGTYGVASAQFYWSRVAAMLTRLTYHISEQFLWIMVDFMLLLCRHLHVPFLSRIPRGHHQDHGLATR